MQWKQPKNSSKYQWTNHVTEKMHYYGLSEQKVLGVIRCPKRIETGIVENTVAVMLPVGNITKGNAKPKWGRPFFTSHQGEESDVEEKNQPAGGEESWNQEIWVMYQINKQQTTSNIQQNSDDKQDEESSKKLKKQFEKFGTSEKAKKLMKLMPKKLIIISAWRYPGVSPKNNPIPEEIIREIEEVAMR